MAQFINKMDPRLRKPETDRGYKPAVSGPVSKLAQSTQRGRGRPLNRRTEPT
jgi:hypothetical protein